MNSALEHPFFSDLPAEHVDALGRIATPLQFADGAGVCEQGDAADMAFFITSGNVDITIRVPGGAENRIALLGPGEVLGELSLIDHHRRSSSARAVGPVSALGIERRDLAGLCAQYHPASLELMHRIAKLVGKRLLRATPGSRMELAAHGKGSLVATELSPETAGATFNIRPFMPLLPFFRDFSQRDMDEFLEVTRTWTLPRGRIVSSPLDPSRSCFVVVRGAAEVVEHMDGSSHRYAILGPGSLFGELPWLLDVPRGAEIRSRETCTLLELPVEELDRLRRPDRHLSFRFHESLVRNLMLRLVAQTRALARNRQQSLTGIALRQEIPSKEGVRH